MKGGRFIKLETYTGDQENPTFELGYWCICDNPLCYLNRSPSELYNGGKSLNVSVSEDKPEASKTSGGTEAEEEGEEQPQTQQSQPETKGVVLSDELGGGGKKNKKKQKGGVRIDAYMKTPILEEGKNFSKGFFCYPIDEVDKYQLLYKNYNAINYREIVGDKNVNYPFNLNKYNKDENSAYYESEIQKLLDKIEEEYKGDCETKNILHSLGRWVQYFQIEKDKPNFENNVYKSMYEQGWRGSFKNSLENTTERNKRDMGKKRLDRGDTSLESGQTPEQRYRINKDKLNFNA